MMKILTSLENPEQLILAPNIWLLQIWGLWQPNCGIRSVMHNLIHLAGSIIVITQFVELWIIQSNQALAFRNLSYSLLSSICFIKTMNFVIWQKDWKCIAQYMITFEKHQRSKRDSKTDAVILEYTNYSRNVTFFYWCLVSATLLVVLFEPLIIFISSPDIRNEIRNGTKPYPEIFNSWVPFEKERGHGYIVYTLSQAFGILWGGGVIASFDSTAVTMMSCFVGQLKLLKLNCEQIFGDENEFVTDREVLERIKYCHNLHVDIVKFSKIFNSLLSPVLFLYVIICSLMICVSAIQLQSVDGTTKMQQIWITEYLLAIICQLFIYCWHSNEVFSMSKTVNYGVTASRWWSRKHRMLPCIILLSGQLKKTIQFTAGPFTSLDTATFIAIVKGAYSYYTLLRNED